MSGGSLIEPMVFLSVRLRWADERSRMRGRQEDYATLLPIRSDIQRD
jgi:hypothetical protein